MTKVFLVDDEIIVRESIRTAIDWDQTPYSLIGEAPDGEMALAAMLDLKPDILLTDIRMPFMDGLTLAGIVKKDMPWVRIIILSGHDEFEYAKQAISLGVSAYLLKPVSPAELMETLDEVSGQIAEERGRQQDLERLQQLLSGDGWARSEQMLEDLITGAIGTAEALEIAKAEKVDLLGKFYLVMTLAIRVQGAPDQAEPLADGKPGSDSFLRARAIVQQLATDQEDIVSYYSGMNRFVILLKGTSAEALEEFAFIQARSLRHLIESEVQADLTISLGPIVDRIGKIQMSYAESDIILQRLGAVAGNKTYSYHDLSMPKESELKQLSSRQLAEQLKYAALDELPEIIEQHFVRIGDQPLQSLLLSYYVLIDVLIIAGQMIESYGGDPKQVLPDSVHSDQLITVAFSQETLREKILDVLTKTLNYRDSHIGSKYADVIRRSSAFIQENFTDPDLSLNQVAAAVSLSNNHFCTIFAQETGRTFIEHLTELRIERAAELLKTTQMLASEIAYASGYNDPHYFSYIFKKHKGLPPRDYRQKTN